MKKLMNKNFIQKTVIAILIVLSFNFVVPTFSRADFGGILLSPVIDLLASIGDIVMLAMEAAFGDSENISISASGLLADPGDVVGGNYTEKYKEIIPTSEDLNSLKNAIIIKADELDRGFLGLGGVFGYGYGIPTITVSPEAIFSNKIAGLDANFINPEYKTDNSIAYVLQKTIASWYIALRNLVIVGLLSVLLYVAIRMIISSTAADKAKYKQMILDWIIALCLLFFLHYIMSFTMSLINIITKSIGEATTNVIICVQDTDFDGGEAYFKLNLMQLCRFNVQYSDLGKRLLYLIMYIALIIYTVKFVWEYMKRAIKLAFLTLMAPLVTLTYPIDKMGDGKAQAFNMWLKEYVFTALIQPFHLIIYTIFMTSAMALMDSGSIFSVIYAILFLAFMTPAEKLLKKFFRFDEKGGAGGSSFAGGFSGAAAFNALKGAASKGAAMIGGHTGGNKGGNAGNNIRTKNPVPANNGPDGLGAFAHAQESDKDDKLQKNNVTRMQEREALEEKIANGEIDKSDLTKEQRAILEPENDNINGNAFGASAMNGNIEGQDPIRMQEREALEEKLANNEIDESELTSEQRSLLGESQSPEITKKQTPKVIKGAAGAFKGAGRYIGDNLHKRFATKEGWKRNGIAAAKFAGRTAARVAGVGIGATIGLAAGITGDDLEDVVKYGVAGTALGGKVIGDGIIGAGRRIANSGLGQAVSKGARESYHGGVKEAQAAQNSNRLKASGELREYIGNNITDENGQRLSNKALDDYENRAIDHYNAGITDNSEIKKTLKLEDSIRKELADSTLEEEERNNLARQQAETVAKYAEQFNGDKFETNEEYRAKKREEFAVGIRKVNPNLSESQVKQNSEQMIKRICQYKKITYRKD